jgi:glycosyltransferase involved in cell wall biosynthesis
MLTSSQTIKRILVVMTEDWFALSHFRPLLKELTERAPDVVLAARSSGRLHELADLGIRTIDFRTRRGSLNPLDLIGTARKLARLIDAERPDVVHAISLQPILLASIATKIAKHKPKAGVLHITGMGYLAASKSPKAALLRALTFGTISRSQSRRVPVWLLAENTHDIDFLLSYGLGDAARVAISPGAGIDVDEFRALPAPENSVPQIAYVGRLVRSKGIQTLVEAHQILTSRGVAAKLVICGNPDPANPDTITEATLDEWRRRPHVDCPGHISDVRKVWEASDIAAVPTLGGEGIPRALLEAAACARPIVASNVPGCRDFVRPGIEGALVPPGDALCLAAELETLVRDPLKREAQGTAARQRLVAGYSTKCVSAALRQLYADIAASDLDGSSS